MTVRELIVELLKAENIENRVEVEVETNGQQYSDSWDISVVHTDMKTVIEGKDYV